MSSPAIHALKKSLNCHITLLTSSAGAGIAPHIGDIDDIIEHLQAYERELKAQGASS